MIKFTVNLALGAGIEKSGFENLTSLASEHKSIHIQIN